MHDDADALRAELARLTDRVARLEEAVLFAERTNEQLSGEVRALGDRVIASERTVRELREALSALLARVTQAETARSSSEAGQTTDEELKAERPPHHSGRAQGY